MENNTPKKLYRSTKNELIGGVCGGIGEYFNVDPTIIRLVAVLFGLSGGGLLAYIVALIIVPKAPAAEEPPKAEPETAASPVEEPSSDNKNTPTML